MSNDLTITFDQDSCASNRAGLHTGTYERFNLVCQSFHKPVLAFGSLFPRS
jgi:hypothetical protein